MSYEPHAHPAQIAILRHLLFSPMATFAQMQRTTQLSSDHFAFHLKKLTDEGYVEKGVLQYTLTSKGKEYANRLDTQENEIEKQPKISIAIILERVSETGEREFLFQQRKKQPYYGFWGKVGGKMRWGETVLQAAQRELAEETGLVAELEYRLLYHKRDFDTETGELLEDKIFLCMYGVEYSGELLEQFEGGVNRWMTGEVFRCQPRRFRSVDEFIVLIDTNVSFVEREFHYDKTEY